MNRLIYLLVFSVCLGDYFSHEYNLRVLGWLPELLSIIAVVIVIGRISLKKPIYIHPKYILLSVFASLLVIISIINSGVEFGAIFAGIRNYFKYVPFLLLPAVYTFSSKDILNFFKLILILALIQVPLALYQRFIEFGGLSTGDVVSGTLDISSILSLFLVSTVSILLAFYQKKYISLKTVLILAPLLLLPTTVNETKGTFVLLFIMLASLIWFSFTSKGTSRNTTFITFAGVALIAGFVVIYNMGLGMTQSRGINEFDYKEYLYKNAEGSKSLEDIEKIGKFDSVMFAYRELSKTPVKLVMGLGIGNVSESYSEKLQGEYENYSHLKPQMTSLSHLLWEVGFLGVMLLLVGCTFIYVDTRALIKQDGDLGAIALGWSIIVLLFVFSLAYKDIISHNTIAYLFAFFSGYIVTERSKIHS